MQAHLLATPSAKVANRAAFSLHARHRLLRLRETLDLFGRKRQRRLRWHSFMRRQQAMTRQVRAITAGSPDTVVTFGNAQFRHYGPGCPAVPTVSLRRQLRLHCRCCTSSCAVMLKLAAGSQGLNEVCMFCNCMVKVGFILLPWAQVFRGRRVQHLQAVLRVP